MLPALSPFHGTIGFHRDRSPRSKLCPFMHQISYRSHVQQILPNELRHRHTYVRGRETVGCIFLSSGGEKQHIRAILNGLLHVYQEWCQSDVGPSTLDRRGSSRVLRCSTCIRFSRCGCSLSFGSY